MYYKHVDLLSRNRNYAEHGEVKLSGIEKGKQITVCEGLNSE